MVRCILALICRRSMLLPVEARLWRYETPTPHFPSSWSNGSDKRTPKGKIVFSLTLSPRAWSAGITACGQPLTAVSQCSQCAAERAAAALLQQRRKKEQQVVASIDRMHLEPGEMWCVLLPNISARFPFLFELKMPVRYIIDRQWLMDWLDFANQDGPVSRASHLTHNTSHLTQHTTPHTSHLTPHTLCCKVAFT